MNLFYLVPCFGILALLYTFVKSAWVTKQDAGNDRMKEISTYIAEGAMAFLKAEYKVLGYFVVIAALLLAVMGYSSSNWLIAVAFIIGAVFSALAGLSVCVLLQKLMCVPHMLHVPASAKPSRFRLAAAP